MFVGSWERVLGLLSDVLEPAGPYLGGKLEACLGVEKGSTHYSNEFI